MKQARFFLTLDSSGALIVGLFVLLFSSFLANLTGWTESFTHMEGFANLIYGSYSGTLLLRLKKGNLQRVFVFILIIANSFWGLQCFAQAWRLKEDATSIGTAILLLEGVYLVALSYFEARFVLPQCVSRSSQISKKSI
ncbi:hypothetical protein [Leptospira licerasiae]|uniref:DUF4293 family protein n=1 Tax=Leptospira licerasiae str. MMD4847 TaxID=1049971 RepID=A0ABP2RCA8_9LEPT|nr:hypothetical protein [Leptospira licerasiae]EIE00776.1 hypothetical protein LEP1GSC185_0389 [Leptospira licerasiae serovar Varillal str. VAR 010]EJZ40826.1 hypothetical protein LEP1GSC178_1753 [Leptospira licerasiae str. MMD4847]